MNVRSATAISSPPSASVTSTDEKSFVQAMQALDQGNSSRAETILKPLHAHYPHNFEINESLGLLLAGKGNIHQALPLLQAAALEEPSSDVAHLNLGTAYFKLRQTQKATQEFERAVHLNPANASAQAALGQAEMLLNHPEQASSAFRAALTLDPSNSDLIYNAALAEFESGQNEKAAALLANSSGLSQSAPAQSLYGDIEERLANYKQAVEHYQQAVQLEPSEGNVYLLGIEFLRHWTFRAAIQEFSAGAQKFPQSQRMRRGLGIAYYGDGQYDKAIPILANLLAEDPDNVLDANILGRTCTVLTEGLNPKCTTLIQFAEAHPRNAMLATYAASSILHQPSNPAGIATAEKLLRAAITANPKLPEAQLEWGVLLQQQSKWAESIAPLEAALRLQPDLAQAHYRLSRAYAHAGRHQEAQQQIALNIKYTKQQEDSLNARMKDISTFVVKMQ